MKKILIFGLLAFGAYKLFAKSATAAEMPQILPSDTNDGSRLEGHIVIDEQGNWFVVHNGKRYFTTTPKSLTDYQAANPDYSSPINANAGELDSYPIAGSLGENVTFVAGKH